MNLAIPLVASSTGAAATPAVLPPARRSWLPVVLLAVLLGVLLVAILLSAVSGQMPISPVEVISSVAAKLGIGEARAEAPYAEAALWTVRFPRVVLALLVGACLAVAGVLMQGIFGNPLAEPGVIGVSSGAAVGASAVIVFGLSWLGPWTMVAAAFAGGLGATMLAYRTARRGGRTEVVTLVLTGVAVNAVCGAVIALMVFLGDTQAREQIVFWQLGSLNGARWVEVAVVAPVAVVGIAVAVLLARQLDLLSLGERSARHLGVDVERLRRIAILVVALLTSAAVAFGGIISFVGLVVPHLVRMAIGPSHRWLLIVSGVGGAALLLVADLMARTLVTYAELPIGMLTALVGGPFFFWLIRRSSHRAGGWA